MITVGRKVMERLTFQSGGVLLKGTVVYVHPLGRFYTVEFKVGPKEAVIRESYPMFRTKPEYGDSS